MAKAPQEKSTAAEEAPAILETVLETPADETTADAVVSDAEAAAAAAAADEAVNSPEATGADESTAADADEDLPAKTYVKAIALTMDMRDPYTTDENPWLRVGEPRKVELTGWLASQIDAGYVNVVAE